MRPFVPSLANNCFELARSHEKSLRGDVSRHDPFHVLLLTRFFVRTPLAEPLNTDIEPDL